MEDKQSMHLRRLPSLAVAVMLFWAGEASASAEEVNMNALQTLSSTTISSYVDTSVEWTLGDKDNAINQSAPAPIRRSSWWNSLWFWLRTHRWF